MSAICGFVGQGSAAVLEAILATDARPGSTTAIEVVAGAGVGVRGHTPVIKRDGSVDGTTLAAVVGSFAPQVANPSAELVSILADPARLAALDGQFAAATWTGETKTLRLLCDPFGARALYTVTHDGTLYFASALKHLLAIPGLPVEVDPAVIHKYLTFSFVPGEEMPIAGIKRLRAGRIATFTAGQKTDASYFKLTEQIDDRLHDQPTAVRFIRGHCREAVARRIAGLKGGTSEVGLFLSGGIDSSGVGVWLKQAGVKFRAFTLDFGTDSFEREQAEQVAAILECPLTHVPVGGGDLAAILPDLVWNLDLPFGDGVTGPQYFLAKAAREAGITTVFNGEGGDQLFGGWTSKPMIAAALYAGMYGEDSREQAYLKSYRRFYGLEDKLYTPAFADSIGPVGVRRALLQPFLNSDRAETFLNRVRLADISLKGSQNILPRMTATAASHGIEIAAPLFDRTLAEASFKLPPAMKLHGACEKYVLKLALQKALPPDIVWQRKLGMGVPITHWALGDLKPVMDDLLGDASVTKRGLFQTGYIAALRQGHDTPDEVRRRRIGERLWTLAMLEAWMRIFIDGKGKRPHDGQDAREGGSA